MTFELSSLIEARQGENFRLHSEYLNPQLVKVLKTGKSSGSQNPVAKLPNNGILTQANVGKFTAEWPG